MTIVIINIVSTSSRSSETVGSYYHQYCGEHIHSINGWSCISFRFTIITLTTPESLLLILHHSCTSSDSEIEVIATQEGYIVVGIHKYMMWSAVRLAILASLSYCGCTCCWGKSQITFVKDRWIVHNNYILSWCRYS